MSGHGWQILKGVHSAFCAVTPIIETIYHGKQGRELLDGMDFAVLSAGVGETIGEFTHMHVFKHLFSSQVQGYFFFTFRPSYFNKGLTNCEKCLAIVTEMFWYLYHIDG